MDDKKWFVIKTRPKAEKIVSKRLTDLGIENYVPIKKTLKQWKDRKKYIDEVLIKSYVFVKTTERTKNKVFEAFGAVRYLFFAGKIAVITDKEIEVLQIFCQIKELKIVKKGFETGDKVQIISGLLIGLTGVLNTDQNGNKISIYIAQLALFANITIDINEVAKIN